MTTTTSEIYPSNPRCPNARNTSGYCAESDEYIEGADMCDLVDKWCLLDGGQECETYTEFLQKQRRNDCPLAGGIECCEDCSECQK